MRCPECDTKQSSIIESRTTRQEKFHRRRHVCFNGHRFTTIELVHAEFIELLRRAEVLDHIAHLITTKRPHKRKIELKGLR